MRPYILVPHVWGLRDFVHDHLSLHELQSLAKAITQKRLWLRFRSVILAQHGVSARDIARVLGCSRRGVQSWIAKYNKGGVSACTSDRIPDVRLFSSGRISHCSSDASRIWLSPTSGFAQCGTTLRSDISL